MDSESTPWIISTKIQGKKSSTNVLKYENKKWKRMGSLSRPQQIATGPNDSIYALAGPKQGANYAIYKWQNNTWAMLPRYASSISVSSSGDLFITDVGKIYSTSNITEAQLSTKDEYLKCNIDEILTD